MDPQEQQDKQVCVTVPWRKLVGVAIFIVLLLIIVYLMYMRYSLVSDSIRHSDSSTSVLLLSPEIAYGLSILI
jgi:hypothetical protein